MGHKAILLLLSFTVAGCRRDDPPLPKVGSTMQISSKSFEAHQEIPEKFSADGGNVSPSLAWSPPPTGTKSLALIVDDPDAPGGSPFVHWVLFNINPAGSIPEGSAPSGSTPGLNDTGGQGYTGPRPPSGRHRYFFHVYALDTELNLPRGSSKGQLVAAMKGHILANGEIVGQYTHR